MINISELKPIEILLVEDSPSDTALTIEALKAGKTANHLTRVEDGVEAMDFVRHRGKYANALRPDLIMLDLNLPCKDGREVPWRPKRFSKKRTLSGCTKDKIRTFSLLQVKFAK